MKTFQIVQNFGKGSLAFEYFDMDDNSSLIEVLNKAHEVQEKSYNERRSGWFGKALEKPTIKVKEYSRTNNKIIKDGISFSFKWR